ncbi:hypothetical protein A3L11_08490 [Thermococcus siculi]|uniref:Type III-B CRISPR module-associated protein Cmr3 n=1 Tax=Thermococcus siculi TaxID=72803 RepID=A0A2Z2MYN9_9EURY|nr:type III-B CRISPR module-associated protein Cmr3 [Thermococcus siculi]ASJ09263.1 hypothetical protein A3L11_08490 [Thermococcus siculi]
MIRITPYDVLFFRESRDFSAGENHVAESIEPMPHTIAGALMGILFEKGRTDLINLEIKIKNPQEWAPGFSVLGAFFDLDSKTLFRIPMDVVEFNDEPALLEPHETSMGKDFLVAVRGDERTLHFGPTRGFLDANTLREYLEGTLTPGDLQRNTGGHRNIVKPEEIYERETRTGIGLEASKTTREGLLYRITTLRLKKGAGIDLYIEKNEEELRKAMGDSGVLKLGGESRFAGFEFLERDFPIEIKERVNIKGGKRFRLYLATPVVVKGNSVTEFFEEEVKGARVLRIFTDRPLPVTGWDMVKRMPKPIRWALPAGTVVWMEAKGNVNIPSKLGEMKELGYGLVLVGKLH